MKKRITYFIALLIALILCLNGCSFNFTVIGSNSPINKYKNYVPTQEELDFINEVWSKSYYMGQMFAETPAEAVKRPDYLGKYGDCILFLLHYMACAETDFIVGNYVFHGSYCNVVAVHQNNCYDLDDAYYEGLIPMEDIKILSETVAAVGKEFLCDSYYVEEETHISHASGPIEIPYEITCDIVKKVFGDNWILEGRVYIVRCFGIYDGAYAVYIDEGTGRKNIYKHSVNGIEFECSVFDKPYIYKDGEVRFLPKAFENGMISEKHLEQLLTDYKECLLVYPASERRWIKDKKDCPESCSDNEIIITLMPYADPADYTAESFSEIGCVAIEDITVDVNGVEKRGMKLTLNEHSRENVINAMIALLFRGDIYSIEAYEE